ncbi:hypothetical protein CZ787_09205 [Halomonas citrativorans]|uniref:Uncharacterized protein n=1 Tax=Halomonas citrativorans TaxID=2742612 RepID=A0A1R4I009_9GAMM|nr:hypothetical protein CZ787_09205 [Halomonas citrativorans]
MNSHSRHAYFHHSRLLFFVVALVSRIALYGNPFAPTIVVMLFTFRVH